MSGTEKKAPQPMNRVRAWRFLTVACLDMPAAPTAVRFLDGLIALDIEGDSTAAREWARALRLKDAAEYGQPRPLAGVPRQWDGVISGRWHGGWKAQISYEMPYTPELHAAWVADGGAERHGTLPPVEPESPSVPEGGAPDA